MTLGSLTQYSGNLGSAAGFKVGNWTMTTTGNGNIKGLYYPSVFLTSMPYGLNYAMLFQIQGTAGTAALSRTFTNCVKGSSYMVSFWYGPRLDTSNIPQSLSVTLAGMAVWNAVLNEPFSWTPTWIQATTAAAVAPSTTLTLAITSRDAACTSTDCNLVITAVTLVGPMRSDRTVYVNSGMVNFGYTTFDGYTSIGTTSPTFQAVYADGNGASSFTINKGISAGAVAFQYNRGVNSFSSSGGYWSNNSPNLNYLLWLQVNSVTGTQGLTKTFNGNLVVGGAYRVDFWMVLRGVGVSAATALTVNIDGTTVYNAPLTSTTWTFVSSRVTTVGSNSATLQFIYGAAPGVSSVTDTSMGLGPFALVGQMALPAVPSAKSWWQSWDGYAIIGSCTTNNGVQTYVTGNTIGSWTVSKLNGGLVALVYVGCQDFPSTNPYDQYYSVWLQSGGTPVNSISRAYTEVTAGTSYSVQFWYVARSPDASSAPTNFAVTCDSTTVWNTPPSSTSWVSTTTVYTLYSLSTTDCFSVRFSCAWFFTR